MQYSDIRALSEGYDPDDIATFGGDVLMENFAPGETVEYLLEPETVAELDEMAGKTVRDKMDLAHADVANTAIYHKNYYPYLRRDIKKAKAAIKSGDMKEAKKLIDWVVKSTNAEIALLKKDGARKKDDNSSTSIRGKTLNTAAQKRFAKLRDEAITLRGSLNKKPAGKSVNEATMTEYKKEYKDARREGFTRGDSVKFSIAVNAYRDDLREKQGMKQKELDRKKAEKEAKKKKS